jgi:hypothetical protein
VLINRFQRLIRKLSSRSMASTRPTLQGSRLALHSWRTPLPNRPKTVRQVFGCQFCDYSRLHFPGEYLSTTIRLADDLATQQNHRLPLPLRQRGDDRAHGPPNLRAATASRRSTYKYRKLYFSAPTSCCRGSHTHRQTRMPSLFAPMTYFEVRSCSLRTRNFSFRYG